MRGVPPAGNLVPAELFRADNGHEPPSCRLQLPGHTARALRPAFLGWRERAPAEAWLMRDLRHRTRARKSLAPFPHSILVHKAPRLVRKKLPVPLNSLNELRCGNLSESSARMRFESALAPPRSPPANGCQTCLRHTHAEQPPLVCAWMTSYTRWHR